MVNDNRPAAATSRRRGRLMIALGAVALIACCLELTVSNFLAFNPRAMSSEGKQAARCLSSAEGKTCQWSGWKSWQQLKPTCPSVACMSGVTMGHRYALQRPQPNIDDVIAVGVDVYDPMAGDLWLGHDGIPLHCVDTTRSPGPLEALVRGSGDGPIVNRLDDPRCAEVAMVRP